MKILVLGNHDSNNLFISNILLELKNRGHEFKVFVAHTGEKEKHHFSGLKSEIKQISKLTQNDIDWADCVFSAIQVHHNLVLKEKLFCKKYIFVYNNYMENQWNLSGAEFMFNCGYTWNPKHRTHSACMAIGCPKNDYQIKINSDESEKNILYIDSGHYPFGHIGKMQVANMLLDICRAYPDYNLIVKPRFLPNDINILHRNYEHIYNLIKELCDGKLPKNLVLLEEYGNMQELLDKSHCAVMLCSGAYLDTALRGKNMVIVEGLDSEDKFELRNDIEYKTIYDARKKTGCVVNYKDVIKHLPDGFKCNEGFINQVVAYRENASSKVADVVEFIYEIFLSKGLFPKIQNYSYKTFKTDIIADLSLNWDILHRNRMQNIIYEHGNYLNRIVADIDKDQFYTYLERKVHEYPLTFDGWKDFYASISNCFQDILIENSSLLMDDPLNQAELLRALYDRGCYEEILSMSEDKILCKGPYHYHIGQIYIRQKEYEKAVPHFYKFLEEANSRSFEKYACESSWGVKAAYFYLINLYNGENLLPNEYAQLYLALYEKHNERHLAFDKLKKMHKTIPEVCRQLKRTGKKELASRCKRQRNKNKKYFGWLSRKIYKVAKSYKENGLKYTINKIKSKIKEKTKKVYCKKFPTLYGKRILKKILKLTGKKHDHIWIVRTVGLGEAQLLNFMMEELVKKWNVKNPCFVSHREIYREMFRMYSGIPFYHFEMKHDDYAPYLTKRDVKYKGHWFHVHHCTIKESLEWLHKHQAGDNSHAMKAYKEWSGVNNLSLVYPKFGDDVINSTLEKIGKLNIANFIFFAPEANGTDKISDEFWQFLANGLREKGFDIFVNAKDGISAIGYAPKLNINEAAYLATRAKAIIGLRCGFVEILAAIKERKKLYVLYPCFRNIAPENFLKIYMFENYPFINKEFSEFVLDNKNENFIAESILNDIVYMEEIYGNYSVYTHQT